MYDATSKQAMTPERARVATALQRMVDDATVEVSRRHVRLPGAATVQVLEAGAGQPLVLLHGSGNNAASMLPLMEHLPGRRLLALDRPGHGLSDPWDAIAKDPRAAAVDVLTQLLDALGLDRVDLLGNSTGGFWSLWMALDRPERVRSLVLAGATPLLPGTRPPLPLRLMTTPVLGNLLGRVLPEPSPASVTKMMASMGEGDSIGHYPALIDVFVAAGSDRVAGQATSDELRAVIRGVAGFRPQHRFSEGDLRRLAQPTLLVWGDHDPVGDVDAARRAANAIPQAQLEIMPAGHVPWWGEPALTGRLITEFLDRIDA